jgi:hypothetical protein
VGSRVGLDAVPMRKKPRPSQELNPGRPAHSLVLTGLSRLLHNTCTCIILVDGRIMCSVTESRIFTRSCANFFLTCQSVSQSVLALGPSGTHNHILAVVKLELLRLTKLVIYSTYSRLRD